MSDYFSKYLDKFIDSLNYTDINFPNASVKDDKLTLTWDLPGAKKDNIDISNEDNILIVNGIGGRYQGLIARLRINDKYNMQSADATLADGVLTVTITQGTNATRNKIQIK